MKQRLIEEPDRWIVMAAGREVTRCLVDYAFTFELFEIDDVMEIRIDGPFVLNTGGREHKLVPEETETLCPALTILHKKVDSVVALKQGTLKVSFSDGSYLQVESDPQGEAWELVATEGVLITCLPIGELAIWERAD